MNCDYLLCFPANPELEPSFKFKHESNLKFERSVVGTFKSR